MLFICLCACMFAYIYVFHMLEGAHGGQRALDLLELEL